MALQENVRAFVFIAAICWNSSAFAQVVPVRVSGRPSCATCRIVIADTFSIGKTNDPVLLDIGSRIAITATNVFATGTGSAPIAIYDRFGRFVAPFGKLGSGPGEIRLQNPVLMRAPGDSLYILTGRNADLYSPSRTMARSFPFTGHYQFAVLSSGRLVTTGGFARDTARAVYPVHLLSASGVQERSFGSVVKLNPACSWCALFIIGAGANGTVWSATPQRYELTRWDITGRLLDHILIQNSPWFVEWDAELQSRAPGVVTRVMDISYDSAAGILWIRGAVPLVARGRGPAGGMLAPDSSRDPFANVASIIEAYDINRHELLASLRFEGKDVRLLPGGIAASIRYDSSGFVRYMIGRLTIAR